MSESSSAVVGVQAEAEEVTHWEKGEGWAGLVAQELRGADILVIPTDMSRVLLQGAAEHIVAGPGWHRGHLMGGRATFGRWPTSTLGAISVAALPFEWTLPEHMARWRAAALVLHKYLGFKGRHHKNPITDLDAWDMAPERTASDVYDLLAGAATGQRRCRVGVISHEGSMGPGECWQAATHRGALCGDHAPGGLAWTGRGDAQPWADDDYQYVADMAG